MDSDLYLMQQVKEGKSEKLGILFERYKNPLYGFFYRNTRNHQQSEDLVQNVFFRILKYRMNFNNEGKFSTWMYYIALNLLRDSARKQKRNRHEEIKPHTAIETNTADDKIEQQERSNHLQTALTQLRADYREVIVLSKYQGLKYREIGDILGCSEGAVKVRMFRALAELKTIFDQIEGQ